ncbi:hypothetical protein CP533_3454 [Ophiocordyceps camponoti-saundersi (nom. inval.)]|nr:hypothetical protein CP533_3454 [Ophiocordyceps camponoti-saundersi (nom. inval.)]
MAKDLEQFWGYQMGGNLTDELRRYRHVTALSASLGRSGERRCRSLRLRNESSTASLSLVASPRSTRLDAPESPLFLPLHFSG